MKRTRIHRRSFLAQVAGGGLGFGAMAVIGTARAQEAGSRMAVDADPGDPARPAPASPYDSDSGQYGDNTNLGGMGRVTDTDTGPKADPVRHGRGRRASQTTDSDAGPNADAVGHGRAGPEPAPAPGQHAIQGPLESFVICPGHPRCPQ